MSIKVLDLQKPFYRLRPWLWLEFTAVDGVDSYTWYTAESCLWCTICSSPSINFVLFAMWHKMRDA